jgi:hypothetical protein
MGADIRVCGPDVEMDVGLGIEARWEPAAPGSMCLIASAIGGRMHMSAHESSSSE